MDWSKAKTIFIILLFLLNLFLLVNIFISSSNLSVGSDYISYARELLNSADITVDTQIPSYSKNSGKVDYAGRKIQENDLVKALFGQISEPSNGAGGFKIWKDDTKILEIGNNTISFTGLDAGLTQHMEDARKLAGDLEAYMKELKLLKYELTADSISSLSANQLEIRFIEKYKDQYLFDNTLTFRISKSGSVEWELVARDVEKIIDYDEILSAYQILVMADIPQHSVITKVDFGYKKVIETELYDSPVWRIVFKTGEIDFYNAYTGEKLVK